MNNINVINNAGNNVNVTINEKRQRYSDSN